MAVGKDLNLIRQGLDKDKWETTVILDNLAEQVSLLDLDMRIVWVSPKVSKRHKIRLEDLIGEKCYEIYHRLSEPCEDCPIVEVIKTGRLEVGENRSPDGKTWRVTGTPIYNNQGEMFGVLSTALDITAQRRAELELQELKAFNENIVQNINEGVIIYDLSGKITFTNPSLTRMLGYSFDELNRIELVNLVPIDHHDIIRKANEKHGTGISDRYEVNLKHKNNTIVPVQISGKPLYDPESGAVVGTLAVITDISGLKETERLLAETNAMLMLINTFSLEQAETIEYAALSELIVEQLNKSTSAKMVMFNEYNPNERVLKLKNLKSDQRWIKLAEKLTGKKASDIEVQVSDDDYQEIVSSTVSEYGTFTDLTGGTIPKAISKTLQKISGINWFVGMIHVVEGQLFGTSVIGLTGDQAVPSREFLESYAYITSISLWRLQAEEKVRYLSFHDNLTRLYNRNFLEAEMKRLDTARQLPISIVMADLNGLKLINDTYGHSSGDELLCLTAELLKNSCREEDIIARWGGDEFVILLSQTSNNEANKLVKRIIANSRRLSVKEIPLSIALGFATKNDLGGNLFNVLKEAEDNMYRNKLTESKSGKSAVVNALLKTLAEKSCETEEHTRRMQFIAMQIGKKLNLPDSELKRLALLITLHDIGKINIPEEILIKTGKLTSEEWDLIKKHPEAGYRIARATEDFSHVAEDILSHHEHWDGGGYPRGLQGKKIPLLARIIALADAYEVMSNGRPYKQGMSHDQILEEYKKNAGKHFDPTLTKIFLQLLAKQKV